MGLLFSKSLPEEKVNTIRVYTPPYFKVNASVEVNDTEVDCEIERTIGLTTITYPATPHKNNNLNDIIDLEEHLGKAVGDLNCTKIRGINVGSRYIDCVTFTPKDSSNPLSAELFCDLIEDLNRHLYHVNEVKVKIEDGNNLDKLLGHWKRRLKGIRIDSVVCSMDALPVLDHYMDLSRLWCYKAVGSSSSVSPSVERILRPVRSLTVTDIPECRLPNVKFLRLEEGTSRHVSCITPSHFPSLTAVQNNSEERILDCMDIGTVTTVVESTGPIIGCKPRILELNSYPKDNYVNGVTVIKAITEGYKTIRIANYGDDNRYEYPEVIDIELRKLRPKKWARTAKKVE